MGQMMKRYGEGRFTRLGVGIPTSLVGSPTYLSQRLQRSSGVSPQSMCTAVTSGEMLSANSSAFFATRLQWSMGTTTSGGEKLVNSSGEGLAVASATRP